MVVAPAYAVVGGAPEVGDACELTVTPPEGFVCTVDGLALAEPAPAASEPAPAPTEAPAVDPGTVVVPPADPTPPPPVVEAPAPGAPPVVAPPADSGAAAPTTPGAPPPASTPPSQGGGTQTAPGKTPVTVVTPPGATLQDSANGIDPAGASSGLLAAATVSNLTSADLPTLAAMRSLPVFPGQAGLPLSAYTPAPNLAGVPLATLPPSTRIAAVQAPLLAAGEEAAGGGGFSLADLSGSALPGLLVVLATALVASIGAANVRVWQDRLNAVRS
jgi:hypothetical protein